ncbi:hypothetical protein Fcan01_08538 [Folsomia candida]|uniref:Uncharacterized protein n=1 Tax=Folsomia candida TaxID=158441 RepID=A0A226ELD8_FOLCA|nr:hypothetical protein Fcan01_08538 [Folsomia candida]
MATNHSLEEDASLLLEQIGSSSSLLDDDGISNQALHSCSGCGSSVSSYLHKDSYLAQRKERTLGYEGRYRRTLSPSGMGSNNNNSHKSENGGGVVVGIPPQHPIAPRSMQHMATSTSTTTTSSGKLDTSLTPSGKGRLLIFYSAKRLPHPLPRKAG